MFVKIKDYYDTENGFNLDPNFIIKCVGTYEI